MKSGQYVSIKFILKYTNKGGDMKSNNVILFFHFFFLYVESSFSTLIVRLYMIYIVTHTKNEMGE